MYRNLTQAPTGRSVFIAKIVDARLASQLAVLGLEEGVEVRTQADQGRLQPLWVRCAKSEAILGDETAAKVIVSYDQGRKMCSLIELPQDERGAFITLIGNDDDLTFLKDIEFTFGEPVRLLKKLPCMDYVTFTEKRGLITLRSESACRIWGEMEGHEMSFASSLIRHSFKINKILGGAESKSMMSALGIYPGAKLTLIGLEKNRSPSPGILMTAKDGRLRVILAEGAASRILVRDCEACWTCGECLLTVPGTGEISRPGSK